MKEGQYGCFFSRSSFIIHHLSFIIHHSSFIICQEGERFLEGGGEAEDVGEAQQFEDRVHLLTRPQKNDFAAPLAGLLTSFISDAIPALDM